VDRLYGGDGADRLDAKDGKRGDKLYGGLGNDTCVGDRRDIRVSC
jgi:Ca2+-binding RTX toxin-like protein